MKLRSLTGLPLGLLFLGVGCADPLNTNPLRVDASTDGGTTVDLGGADIPGVDGAVANDGGGGSEVGADVPFGADVSPVDGGGVDASIACTSNAACTASGQLCDTARGSCVQCLSGAQCPGMGQVCLDHRCVAGASCTSSRTCMGLVCETTRGVCVECLADVDCTGGAVCRGNSCVAPPRMCRSSRECTDQVCDTARSACVDCLTDVDCLTGQFCGADNLCRVQVCVPNATSCVDVIRVRVCDARGMGTTDRACGATEVCAMSRCQARVCMPGERSCGSATETRLCNPDGLGYTSTTCTGALTCSGGVCTDCVDGDADGISDIIEGAPSRDTDRDGTPDYRDLDSDGDGFSDRVEGARAYPGFVSGLPALICAGAPDNCDAAMDGQPNYLDADSDNDGVSDADERTRNTNPCARDTDGDGATDLVEQIAGTNPTVASSTLPPTSRAVDLAYGATTPMNVEFSYAQRVRPADVMLVVNSTGSLSGGFTDLRSAVAAVIDGVEADLGGASADVRFGLADYRDFGEGAVGDSRASAFNVRQRLDRNRALARNALSTLAAEAGGDSAEAEVPALFGLLNGLAFSSYGSPFNRTATAADCGGDATAFGWSCFLPGRTPILIIYSDGDWHNGPTATSNFYTATPSAPRYSQLAAEMVRRAARFIAVDVGSSREHATASTSLAAATGNVPSSGSPFVFVGTASATQSQVVAAVSTIVGQGRSPVSTAVIADSTETRLPTGRRTSEFVRAVNAVRGVPDAPTGYDRRDGGTFVGVAIGTVVTFNAVLANDLVMPSASDQVFTVYVSVANSALTVEQRTFYVVVPAQR